MQITISDYLAQLLKKTGSDTVFGIPSYVALKIIAALKVQGFKMILNSHEQNAAHAAEGYYYATGKLGIVALAVGPGLTNAMTGIANAYIESIPMLVLAGRPYAVTLGKNEYHSNTGIVRTLDEQQMIKSCTKANYVIDSPQNAVTYINDAIRTALSGRPGPVYLSIPPELQVTEVNVDKIPELSEIIGQQSLDPNQAMLDEFKQLFAQAQKPLFIIGKEYSSADHEILQTLLTDNAPYFTTYGAKGRVPLLPNYLGTAWYSNSEHLTEACQQADLIVAFGEDFAAMSTRAIRAELAGKLIQITPFIEEIGRICPVQKGYVASPTNFMKIIQNIKKPWSDLPQKQQNQSVTNEYLKVISQEINYPATYFADVGNAGYASITELALSENQKFYTPGKNGICGFSTPAAVGYSIAAPEFPVISIVGDLSFLMNMQEIVNVKTLKTKNSFFVFNNHVPQNIYADQIIEVQDSIQCDMPAMNLEGAALFAGLDYKHFNTPQELQNWLQTVDLVSENYLVELEIPHTDSPLRGD